VNGVDTGRNSFRNPGYKRCDLRVSKNIKLGRDRSLDLAVDVFNVFNSDNLFVNTTNSNFLNNNPNLDVPNQQSGDPRTAQLSARIRF
jgi:hypothetical protein